jgi:hypothetical protein
MRKTTNDPMKRLTLDIETSPISGKVWGLRNQFLGLDQIEVPTRMLSVAAKWYGDPKTQFFAAFDDDPDQQRVMVESIWQLVNEAHVLIHFNGKGFDMRHLNREFKEQGLAKPSPYQYIDLLKVVRKEFYLPSYKLEYVLRWLKKAGKVQHSGFAMWNDIHSSDPKVALKARKLFEKYNIGDVVKTEDVYDELKGWVEDHPNMQLFVDRGDQPCCPVCGSVNIKKDGTAPRGNLSRVQKYECKDCGKFFRGKETIVRAEER